MIKRPGFVARWLVDASIREIARADRVVADSVRTRDDLVTRAGVSPNPIRVIHPALRPDVLSALRESPLSDGPSRDPFILHVGNDGFYKNRAGVVRIVAEVRRHVPVRVVFAGAPGSDELMRVIHELGLTASVEFVADPSLRDLAKLYRSASLLLFPSIYEGFGWPPLEAMAASCPVVTSNAASLPEVVGDAALTASPDDVSGLAGQCLRILTNRDIANDLRRRGERRIEAFSIEEMGRSLLTVYREAIAAHSGDHR